MYASNPNRKARQLAACLLLLAIVSSVGCATTASVAQRLDRLDAFALRADVNAEAVVAKANELFANDYAPESLVVSSVPDLNDLFQAAEYAAFHDDHGAVDKLERVLGELQMRSAASQRHYAETVRYLVQARQFERARRIHSQAVALGHTPTPPPELVDSTTARWQGPTELAVSVDARNLTRRAVDLSGLRLVVSWHPNCHFSRGAHRDIVAQPALHALFQRYGKLLAPVDSAYELDSLQAWNRTHPHAAVSIAYRAEEWPELDLSQMPVFHFLRDGKLVAKVVGWPKEGSADEFLAAAKATGMLDAAATH